MALHLTADDLARCEAASRTMLSPLTSSVDEWRRDVNRTMRELFGGDKSIFMLPTGGRLFFSEEAPDLAAGVEAYVTGYTADAFYLSDAVVDFWNRLRRQEQLDVFTWDGNERMIGRFGYTMYDSEMVSGVLREHRIQDFLGSYTRSAVGEVLLWLLFESKGAARFGDESEDLWRALLPSLNAGLDALARLDAQRHALDSLSDAIVVFGPDRQELHRNAALERLYESDHERERVQIEVTRMAVALHPLAFSRPGSLGEGALQPGTRRVSTKKASYDLSSTLLPPGIFGPDTSLMITITRVGVAELPDPNTLRERYGLTEREAEVALLVAEGHSNDEIAERLFVSPHTVRRHTTNVFDKVDVRSRKALGLKFLQG